MPSFTITNISGREQNIGDRILAPGEEVTRSFVSRDARNLQLAGLLTITDDAPSLEAPTSLVLYDEDAEELVRARDGTPLSISAGSGIRPGDPFEWDSEATYALDETVTWQGSMWINLVGSNVGNAPDSSEGVQWALAAAKGDPGATGADGPEGGRVVTVVDLGAAYELDLEGDKDVVLVATATEDSEITFANGAAGGIVLVHLFGDGNGAWNVSMPGNVTLTTDATDASDRQSVLYDSTDGATFVPHRISFTTEVHTWAVAGTLAVPSGDTDYIPPMFQSVAAGQSLTLRKVRYRINGGTSATFKVTRTTAAGSASDLQTGISATTTTAETTLDDAISDNDMIGIVVTAVSGTPKNLTVSAVFDRAG